MMEKHFSGTKINNGIEGPWAVTWKSPSNIAFVKYWGKHGRQLPMNASVSMTLSSAYTETTLVLRDYHPENRSELEFFFEGRPNPAFGERISNFLESVTDVFPFLEHARLRIDTKNTFPHSAGIASSASAFSALALCLCSLDEKLSGNHLPDFLAKASYVARLGSGSACRSIYGGITLWGESPALDGSSDLYAVPVPEIHENFGNLCDAILLVSSSEKKVSSSKGHGKMEKHPFARARFNQAATNTVELLSALEKGDRSAFIRIVENEALTLHSMMMTSDPGFILMEPETVRLIHEIQEFREEHNLDICFTLDAGPNIHLLYFEEDSEQVHNFIVEVLLKNNKQKNWINDKIGVGPEKIV